MKAYQLIECCCDGRRMGKMWSQKFYFDLSDAEIELENIVQAQNTRASRDSMRFVEDVVEDVTGFCQWNNGIMVYVKEIDIS